MNNSGKVLTVGNGFAHVEITVTVETVVVQGGTVTVVLIVIVGCGAMTVVVGLTVVVDGVMERQEQAEEIPDKAKAVR